MDAYELFDKFVNAISTVWSDIIKNWGSFLTIFIIHTIIVFLITRQYYKHQRENVKSDKELLERKKEEYEKLKKEHAEYKAEIDSMEYQAYLISINKSKKDMSDKNMFQNKKKK